MMSASESWMLRVRAHHEQSLRAQERSSWSSGGADGPLPVLFTADPSRADDPVLNRLRRTIDGSTTVLDVGGGAGRYALPLALRCRHVSVVEPDPGMVRSLHRQMHDLGLTNLSVVPERWQDARVAPADVVLCAHVAYDVEDIVALVHWLTDHARERVLLLVHMAWPLAPFAPFWRRIHDEARINLPALPELLPVLWEIEIYPDLEMFTWPAPETVPDRDLALALLRQFLYVRPESEQDVRLGAALDDLAVETSEGVMLRESRPRREGLLSWHVDR